VIENCWYVLALQGAVEMARLAGAEDDIPDYERRITSIRAAFDPLLWAGTAYRSPGYNGATDDRAQAMAVVAGLSAPENRSAILEVLKRERHASPYMEKYVLEALLQLGEPDCAFNRMTERYAAMLDDDVTTLWELFDPITLEGFGDLGRGTYNHAWSGGPLTVLSQYVAGVAPTAPGFAEYTVRPQLGRLRRVASVTPTRFGSIRVEVERPNDRGCHLRLNSPPGTKARVELPTGNRPDRAVVTVTGPESMKAEKLGTIDGRVVLTVPPGDWSFHLTSTADDD
jgi:hypothetical protein